MSYSYAGLVYDPDYLAHHGIKGQRWGIRRYQNPDGTLTEVGKKRYGNTADKVPNRILYNQWTRRMIMGGHAKNANESHRELAKAQSQTKEFKELNSFLKEHTRQRNLNDEDFKTLIRLQANMQRKGQELYEEWRPKLADATLKDLDYEITEKGRNKIYKVLGRYL